MIRGERGLDSSSSLCVPKTNSELRMLLDRDPTNKDKGHQQHRLQEVSVVFVFVRASLPVSVAVSFDLQCQDAKHLSLEREHLRRDGHSQDRTTHSSIIVLFPICI